MTQLLGQTIAARQAVAGGDICAAYRATLSDGRTVFFKTAAAPANFFAAEAAGLDALRGAGALAVPEVLEVAEDRLVLEWMAPGARTAAFWERLGRGLAELHRATQQSRHGFYRSGYLGRTPQPNPWHPDGATFWADARLGHQRALVRQDGHATPALERAFDAVLARLPALVPSEPACLLHGDLWSGNVLARADEAPVLIDPAVHYSYREADLAMTRLFGGFDARFYAAYDEAWPLDAGWGARHDLFAAYHLLNHLHLFGRSYYDGALRALQRYA